MCGVFPETPMDFWHIVYIVAENLYIWLRRVYEMGSLGLTQQKFLNGLKSIVLCIRILKLHAPQGPEIIALIVLVC
jgi:hypothetical protein